MHAHSDTDAHMSVHKHTPDSDLHKAKAILRLVPTITSPWPDGWQLLSSPE